jgi:hypothetical protein
MGESGERDLQLPPIHFVIFMPAEANGKLLNWGWNGFFHGHFNKTFESTFSGCRN